MSSTSTSQLHTKMLTLSESIGLPRYFKSDLDSDKSIISKYGETLSYAWVLRERGTVLIPLYVGVSPDFLLPWLRSNEEKVCIHIKGSRVNRSSVEELTRLVNTPPNDLSESAVNSILGYRHWTIFDGNTPDLPACSSAWSQWLTWFSTNKHTIMSNYLLRAIAAKSQSARL